MKGVKTPACLHHLWGKQNYQALFVFRPRTEFMSRTNENDSLQRDLPIM